MPWHGTPTANRGRGRSRSSMSPRARSPWTRFPNSVASPKRRAMSACVLRPHAHWGACPAHGLPRARQPALRRSRSLRATHRSRFASPDCGLRSRAGRGSSSATVCGIWSKTTMRQRHSATTPALSSAAPGGATECRPLTPARARRRSSAAARAPAVTHALPRAGRADEGTCQRHRNQDRRREPAEDDNVGRAGRARGA